MDITIMCSWITGTRPGSANSTRSLLDYYVISKRNITCQIFDWVSLSLVKNNHSVCITIRKCPHQSTTIKYNIKFRLSNQDVRSDSRQRNAGGLDKSLPIKSHRKTWKISNLHRKIKQTRDRSLNVLAGDRDFDRARLVSSCISLKLVGL